MKLEQWEKNSVGSVGRAVASDEEGPRFESNHWQNLIVTIFTLLTVEKKKRKKRPGMTHF